MARQDLDPTLRAQLEEVLIDGGIDKLGQPYRLRVLEGPGKYKFTVSQPHPKWHLEIPGRLRTAFPCMTVVSFTDADIATDGKFIPASLRQHAIPRRLATARYILNVHDKNYLMSYVEKDEKGCGRFSIEDVGYLSIAKAELRIVDKPSDRDGRLALAWTTSEDGSMIGALQLKGVQPGKPIEELAIHISQLFSARPRSATLARVAQK